MNHSLHPRYETGRRGGDVAKQNGTYLPQNPLSMNKSAERISLVNSFRIVIYVIDRTRELSITV